MYVSECIYEYASQDASKYVQGLDRPHMVSVVISE